METGRLWEGLGLPKREKRYEKKLRQPAMRVKVLSLGESRVGKSCLIKRYCEQKFVSRYIPTIGVDFGVKSVMVANLELKVNFWDLSGVAEYADVRNEFYKDTQAALLVYDVTSRKSFQQLDAWLKEAASFECKPLLTIVIANKIDLKRAVSTEEGKSWAATRGFPYFETSANTGENVTALFQHIFEQAATAWAK